MYFTNKNQLEKHKIEMQQKSERKKVQSEINTGIRSIVAIFGFSILILFFLLIFINIIV
jgi:hypothetical protein